METEPRTVVVIPAFNEQESLPAVLAELADTVPELAVAVIDDGSADATADVARAAGAVVLRLPFNLGIGGALRAGFRFAVEEGFDRAVQFDADGQHDASQIQVLLDALDEGADMAIGNRFGSSDDYEVGATRGLAMRSLRWLTRRLAGQSFVDTSSGFRAVRRPLLERFATEYPVEYMDSVETLISACRAGFDVREVPTTMRARAGGQPSNRSFRLVYNYLRLLVTVMSSTLRRRPRPT
ncbi:MAG: glycosyltransferase family 2 protein [Acidimicrobiia bacterium]|nr:glycosyltransferase family 2 protein [Acidimicrobiia bacterium]MDH5236497.1 glycosyltransferase family 2 protein [Acidimicrobiia bacterium]